MKITLLAQNINEETYKELAMPIGLCYLASYAKKYIRDFDIDFRIVDGTIESGQIDADLLGISSMSRYIPRAVRIAGEVKKLRKIPVILGGPHITALPHTLPPVFDAGVIDEGEETFIEILSLLNNYGSLTSENLSAVQGISYHRENEVVVNSPRAYIDPMEKIPFPERDLWNVKDRMKWISSSRGCPYACTFCGLARSKYRTFPASYVVDEVIEMKEKYNISAIAFQDDLFIADKKRLSDIVDLIEKRGLSREISFMVSLRADLIDQETLVLLKRMNVTNIFMGIESASSEILSFLKSNTVNLSDIERALTLCQSYDIQVEGSFIIGSPWETRENLKETYDFISDNFTKGRLDMIAVYVLTPFPGTIIWNYAKERGLVSDNMDWSRLNLFTIMDFDREKIIYLNEKIPLDEFEHYVKLFMKLLFTVNQKGIKRMKRNILDPMNVRY